MYSASKHLPGSNCHAINNSFYSHVKTHDNKHCYKKHRYQAQLSSKLRDLNLRNNFLRCTPKLVSIGSTLEILDISHNTLRRCEKDVKYNISFRALDILFMGHNELTLLPNIALNAVNLSELYIENNKFFTLPDLTVAFPNLKTLVISGNSLLCNCSIAWIKVQERKDDVAVTSHGVTCSKYGPYQGQSLGRVSLEQLMDQCDRNQQIECK